MERHPSFEVSPKLIKLRCADSEIVSPQTELSTCFIVSLLFSNGFTQEGSAFMHISIFEDPA